MTSAALRSSELADFAALCRRGASTAADRGRPILVTWSRTSPQLAVDNRVRHLGDTGGRRKFVWASAWSGQRRLAIGTALDISAAGAGRFEEISESWSDTRDGALIGGAGREPSLLGGFSFRSDGGGNDGLPEGLMWLPAAELVETPEIPATLILNAWITSSGAVDAAIRLAADAASTLLADPEDHAVECCPRAISRLEEPSALEWKQTVCRAVEAIEAGTFEKVVLARQLSISFDRPVNLGRVFTALLEHHNVGAVFGAQLGDQWFVGRSPECLVHLHGGRVDTHGLAGSLPRHPDAAHDARLTRELRSDPKLACEHQIVTDFIEQTLRQYFANVQTDATNPVLKLSHIQHLQTAIAATNPTLVADVLRLASALHPTPAVGGHPRSPALGWLAANEPFRRGWYAAPLGWMGADGAGELTVAIRSAILRGTSATVYAGCGIVRGSDPAREYEESCIKMNSILDALGINHEGVAA